MATAPHLEKDKLFTGVPEGQTPDHPPVPPASLPIETAPVSSSVEAAPTVAPAPERVAASPSIEVPSSPTTVEQSVPWQQERPSADVGVDRRNWLRRVFRRSKSTASPSAQSTASSISVKTQDRQAIESVLSEGLTDIYQKMTPQQQARFQTAGKVAAATIETLLTNFRATARKVAGLIRGWLALIPGVNHYFLTQESKLKTDKILQLQRVRKQQERLKKLRIQ